MCKKSGDRMKLKKGDIIVILFVIIAGISWFAVTQMGKSKDAREIVIEVNSEIYKVIPMEANMEKQEIHIDLPEGKYIDIVAEESGAYVKDVICPDKICQKTGTINTVGQSIVCLPNRVVVYIEGESENSVDGVSY